MFIAASHNGISRLYETFGNAGADTVERTLSPAEYSRTWYKQNPPLPRAKWSQRNNNNYQQTGAARSRSAISRPTANTSCAISTLKSKNSILKPKTAGPAAYVFPGDDPRPGGQAELLRLLQMQGCEVHRATAAVHRDDAREEETRATGGGRDQSFGRRRRRQRQVTAGRRSDAESNTRTFPAGSYLVRMDQPYSRIADMMLDLSVLGAERSAAQHLRRHRLDVRRTGQRAGRARDRCQSARRARWRRSAAKCRRRAA